MTDSNSSLIFDAVVSVSYYKDVSSWRYTQHAIASKIQSRQFFLIVDDSDFSLFTFFTTCPSWKIIRASSLIDHKLRKSIESRLKKTHQKLNIGWYIQQFLKLEFLRQFASNSHVLIWDADTYPKRFLNFPKGYSAYYCASSEFHKPYWDFNSHLLGGEYGLYPGFSFISQFFGLNTSFVCDLHSFIVKRHQDCCWLHIMTDLILKNSSKHRFSEYELLGSFIFYSYPEQLKKMTFVWQRDKLVCPRTPLTILPLLNMHNNVHYNALERRHMPGFSIYKDRIQSLIYYILTKVFSLWSKF